MNEVYEWFQSITKEDTDLVLKIHIQNRTRNNEFTLD